MGGEKVIDTRDRYLNDPIFHTVVDHMRSIIRSATLTPSEVREAAMTACVIEEMYNPRPPFTTSGDDLARVFESFGDPRTMLAICEVCQIRVPERLVTYGPGVRGSTSARCAACLIPPGPDGEAKRQEVIAIRRARSSELAGRPGARDVASTPTDGRR
jgi:hypothetical protein